MSEKKRRLVDARNVRRATTGQTILRHSAFRKKGVTALAHDSVHGVQVQHVVRWALPFAYPRNVHRRRRRAAISARPYAADALVLSLRKLDGDLRFVAESLDGFVDEKVRFHECPCLPLEDMW